MVLAVLLLACCAGASASVGDDGQHFAAFVVDKSVADAPASLLRRIWYIGRGGRGEDCGLPHGTECHVHACMKHVGPNADASRSCNVRGHVEDSELGDIEFRLYISGMQERNTARPSSHASSLQRASWSDHHSSFFLGPEGRSWDAMHAHSVLAWMECVWALQGWKSLSLRSLKSRQGLIPFFM